MMWLARYFSGWVMGMGDVNGWAFLLLIGQGLGLISHEANYGLK